MNVSLRMFAQVNHQRIGISNGSRQVIVKACIVNQQAQRAFSIVNLVGKRLHISQSLIHLCHSSLNVNGSHFTVYCCHHRIGGGNSSVCICNGFTGFIHKILGLGRQSWELIINVCEQPVKLSCRGSEVGCNPIYIVKRRSQSRIGK